MKESSPSKSWGFALTHLRAHGFCDRTPTFWNSHYVHVTLIFLVGDNISRGGGTPDSECRGIFSDSRQRGREGEMGFGSTPEFHTDIYNKL